MIILSHRGYWKKDEEKNKSEAFTRSFKNSYGTETDVRDYKGELVISHDIADDKSMAIERFFEIYNEYNNDLFLALNVKADGLQRKLKRVLEEYKIKNYFLFDMSVPDALVSLNNDLNVFTRQSEYENIPSFYEEAQGVWLDSFIHDWIDEDIINEHLSNNKKICIVSPDLHKRDHKKAWLKYKKFSKNNNIFLCTDYPDSARDFFNN